MTIQNVFLKQLQLRLSFCDIFLRHTLEINLLCHLKGAWILDSQQKIEILRL